MPESAENPTSPGFTPPDDKNRAKDPSVRERALKHVLDAFNSARNARGNLPDKWSRAYRAWRAQRNKRDFFGRANIVDPEPSRVVETIAARLEEAILATRPILRGVPREKTGREREQAEIVESLIQYQMEAVKADSTLRSWIKSVIIYGTGILRVYWDQKFQKRLKKRKPSRGQFGIAQEEGRVPEEQLLYKGPHIRLVDTEDFYISSPFCEDMDLQDFVIERRDVAYRTLWSMQQRGILANVDPLKKEDFNPTPKWDEMLQTERALAADVWQDSTMRPTALRKAEVLMYEGAFDLDNDGIEEDCWIWIANGKHVLRVIECPYWHGKKSYVHAPYIRAPGEFYGVNYFEWIEKLWSEICDKHNQALDSVNLSINSPIVAGAGSGLDSTKLSLYPGKIIQIKGSVSEIMPLQIPDHSNEAYKAIGVLQNAIRETTAATDLLQGGSGQTDKATIYQGMVTEANMRIRHTLRNMFDAIERLGDQMYALDHQYIDTETTVRVLGKDGFRFSPVRPEDLSTPMDFKSIGTGVLASIMQKNFGLMQFVQGFAPMMMQGAVKADMQEIAKRFWSDALGYQDGAEIFGDKGPKPMNPEEENLLLSQRQPPDVHPEDDDAAHLRAHLPFVKHEDPIVRQMASSHIQEHQQMFVRKEKAREAMIQFQAQQMMAQAQGGNGQAQQPQQPSLANQQTLGPSIGGPKEMAEQLAGRQG